MAAGASRRSARSGLRVVAAACRRPRCPRGVRGQPRRDDHDAAAEGLDAFAVRGAGLVDVAGDRRRPDALVDEHGPACGHPADFYRAIDSVLQRFVAIKVVASRHLFDPEFRERFQREARVAAGIDHPHAVTV